MNTVTLTSLVALSLQIVLVESCGKSSVTLSNNEYKNVLIGISEKVAEDPQLIERIKKIFTEASQVLYEATRRRAFFKEIKILIPTNWTSISAEPSTEDIGRSDFFVGVPDSEKDTLGLADTPFVIKATGCGEPGKFVHLTPNYILDDSVGAQFGPYGKTLVHEWAHYRWGVYDEYPVDANTSQFYSPGNGVYEGTRCSLASPGYEFNPTTGGGCAYVNGQPEPDCVWKDQETGVVGRQGSLMYKHSLYHILEFCDDDESNEFTLHNKGAPTQQNTQCNGQSVWEVLKGHEDFANGANPPRKLWHPVPEFIIIKPGMGSSKRTVIVLDKSGSMGGERIEVLGQVCNNYITNWIPDGEELGVVVFDTSAQTTLGITTVSTATRPTILNAIPRAAGGSTAIGQGLQQALTMLAGNTNEKGGNIILVSDGQENVEPNVLDVLPDILSAEVVVHSIAISESAEETMEEPARQTGGFTFFLNTATASGVSTNSINEALRQIAQRNLNEDQRDIGLDSIAQGLVIGETVLRSSVIDSTLGSKTKFIFDYSGTSLEFTVTSPSGRVYDQNSPEVSCDTNFGVCRLYIDGIAETGAWTYNITNGGSSTQRVAITVTSQASGGSEPISAQAFWGDSEIDFNNGARKQVLYASVSKGYTPILNANVLATVDRPGGDQVTIQLRDSGTGADVTKDDGVYSAYFVAFTGDGRYAVQVTVNSTDVTTINPARVLGMSSGPTTGDHDSPIESFRRLATGGSFQLQNLILGQPIYEPGKVTDLRVTNVDYAQQAVTLEWTAVGSELDQGQASHYELRYSTSFASLRDEFQNQSEVTPEMISDNKTLDSPLQSGDPETFTIVMPASGNITYVFGVKAWDTNGRSVQGPLSNLVSASMLFREHPAPTEPPENNDDQDSQDPGDTDDDEGEETGNTGPGPGPGPGDGGNTDTDKTDDKDDDEKDGRNGGPDISPTDTKNKIGIEVIIVVSLGSVVVLLVLGAMVLICVRHQQRRKLDQERAWEHFPPPGMMRSRDELTTISRRQRASFPLRFPRFFPPVNNRPRDSFLSEFEWRRTDEFPPDIRQGRGYDIYDTLN